ncbi:MAG: hypothetical protein KDJ90_06775 [Nitratireductor sp.]|nr:hypothetical protein [Nitratireductor sp.]
MKQEATRPEGPTGTKQEARKAEGLTGKNNGNLENMIERGFARALVKAADRRMPRLAALEDSIRAASAPGAGGPQKQQVFEACRLREQMRGLARMAEGLEVETTK